MTDLDTELIPEIYNIVDEFGINATFYVDFIDPEDYSPLTGHTTEDTDAGVVRKVTPPEDYADFFIDGDLIQHGDVRIYLPSQNITFTPELGMKVSIGSSDWRAIAIDPIYSGEEICIYKIQMRK